MVKIRMIELAGRVTPVGESRANEKRVMDTSEPYEISKIKEYMAKKGWTWNFNDKNSHFWFTKDGRPKIEGDLVPWSAYILTNGNDIYFGRSLRNWKADMKAIGLNEANSNEAFDGWDDWEEIEGLEDALDGIENLTYELRSCVRGAKTGCKDWKALSRHIQNLAAKLDDAAGEMAYKRDDEDESKRNESKVYTFTWWDNEPTADRRPTTAADLKNCLHKETFNANGDAEALKMAAEYLCDYIGDDPENVAATPEEIWDYFNGDWGAGNPIPMVLKQRSRVVKDSGFDPNDEGNAEGGWSKTVEKELVKKYKFSPGWAELCVDGNWKGLVSKYLNGNKSPEECAKAINDSGANKQRS